MIEEVPLLISRVLVTATLLAFTSLSEVAHAQLIDRTLAPNAAGEGIAKSLVDQAGVVRGSDTTPASSIFIIDRDPFRAIRRDTASNLNPGDRKTTGFPQFGHGSIKLTVLFNDP